MAASLGPASTSVAPGQMSAGPEATQRKVIETPIRRAILAGMRAAILRRVTVVMAVLALLGAVPVAVAASVAPAGMPGCGALMGLVDGVPCDPAAPEPGQPACLASPVGCAVVALPGTAAAQALAVPHLARLWDPGPSLLLLGRTLEPDLFPPIPSV